MMQPTQYDGLFTQVSKLSPYRGKDGPRRNRLYRACLNAASLVDSELYHTEHGIVYRHSGASHRSAFWAGYDEAFIGAVNTLKKGDKTSDAATCYRAGLDFGKAEVKAMSKPKPVAPKVIAEIDTRGMVISVKDAVYTVTKDGEAVQPNQTAEGVIRYLANILQNTDRDAPNDLRTLRLLTRRIL